MEDKQLEDILKPIGRKHYHLYWADGMFHVECNGYVILDFSNINDVYAVIDITISNGNTIDYESVKPFLNKNSDNMWINIYDELPLREDPIYFVVLEPKCTIHAAKYTKDGWIVGNEIYPITAVRAYRKAF